MCNVLPITSRRLTLGLADFILDDNLQILFLLLRPLWTISCGSALLGVWPVELARDELVVPSICLEDCLFGAPVGILGWVVECVCGTGGICQLQR